MATAAQLGGNGQLPAAKATLLTLKRRTQVRSLMLRNTGVTTETCQIYLNLTGTSRMLPQVILGPDESAQLVPKDSYWPLPAEGFIEGETTNATTVDYIILTDTEL